jgi:type IV pilus assembly protein PilV
MNNKSQKLQRGIVLLEALISVLIFSFGVLAIVGLQAAAVGTAAESKFRGEAGFFANRLIGEMWTSDRATLAADFVTSGPKYSLWYTDMTHTDPLTGLRGLPGADIFPPTVSVVPVVNGVNGKTTSYDVTVTVFWKSANHAEHQHVVYASITTD